MNSSPQPIGEFKIYRATIDKKLIEMITARILADKTSHIRAMVVLKRKKKVTTLDASFIVIVNSYEKPH